MIKKKFYVLLFEVDDEDNEKSFDLQDLKEAIESEEDSLIEEDKNLSLHIALDTEFNDEECISIQAVIYVGKMSLEWEDLNYYKLIIFNNKFFKDNLGLFEIVNSFCNENGINAYFHDLEDNGRPFLLHSVIDLLLKKDLFLVVSKNF